LRDGTALPILNLNGYKIANPAILARDQPRGARVAVRGYGYIQYFVEGDDPMEMHRSRRDYRLGLAVLMPAARGTSSARPTRL